MIITYFYQLHLLKVKTVNTNFTSLLGQATWNLIIHNENMTDWDSWGQCYYWICKPTHDILLLCVKSTLSTCIFAFCFILVLFSYSLFFFLTQILKWHFLCLLFFGIQVSFNIGIWLQNGNFKWAISHLYPMIVSISSAAPSLFFFLFFTVPISHCVMYLPFLFNKIIKY